MRPTIARAGFAVILLLALSTKLYAQCSVAPLIYSNSSPCAPPTTLFCDLYSEGFTGPILFDWYKNDVFLYTLSDYGTGSESYFRTIYNGPQSVGDRFKVITRYSDLGQSCTMTSSVYTVSGGSAVYAGGHGTSCNTTATIVIDAATPGAVLTVYKVVGGVTTNLTATNGQYIDMNFTYQAQYFVKGTALGCTIPPVSILVEDYTPEIPNVTPPSPAFCTGESIILTASTISHGGGTFRWYDSNNSLLATAQTYQVSTAGTYSVAEYTSSCLGPKRTVTVGTLGVKPAPPTVTGVERCGAGQVTLVASIGYGSWRWYRADGTEVVGQSGGKLTVSVTQSTTFKVAGVIGSCMSDLSAPIPVTLRNADYGCENYIAKTDLNTKTTTTEGLPVTLRQTDISFFDGLGREMQVVNERRSPDNLDVVKPITYDAMGREYKSFLPYVSDDNNGYYKPSATSSSQGYDESPQRMFYNSGNNQIAQDGSPFGEKVFERSALNRVVKDGLPGAAWQPVEGQTINDRSRKIIYRLNETSEVLFFKYDALTATLSVMTGNYYPAKSLQTKETRDEHNGLTIDFADKEGRMVCRKIQYGGTESAPQLASTYYVYDDFGNLVVVLPPSAVQSAISAIGL